MHVHLKDIYLIKYNLINTIICLLTLLNRDSSNMQLYNTLVNVLKKPKMKTRETIPWLPN